MKQIHIVVINWRRYPDTEHCLKSLLAHPVSEFCYYCIDNESDRGALDRLKRTFPSVIFTSFDKNLGFSGGYNAFFEQNLHIFDENDYVFLLNNDTEIPLATLEYLAKKHFSPEQQLIATRMMDFKNHEKPENLGTKLYRSGIAANRMLTSEKLFAPSAGGALYSVKLLRELKKKTGEIFDKDFFCYMEDVDLGLRALLLGYKPVFDENIVIFHKGGASTGGHFNDFIMVHTLRNHMLMMVKCFPLPLIIRILLPVIGFQMLLVLRYAFSTRLFSLIKAYAGFWLRLPKFLKKRKSLFANLPSVREDIRNYMTSGWLSR